MTAVLSLPVPIAIADRCSRSQSPSQPSSQTNSPPRLAQAPRLQAVQEDRPSPPRGEPLPPVPVCEQAWIAGDLDIVLSTHATVVVHARLEPGDGGPSSTDEDSSQALPGIDLDLVIARKRCRGDRPQLAALLEAAQVALRRTQVGARHGLQEGWQLVTRVAGRPCRLVLSDGAAQAALQRPTAA